ncbi:DGQHR domain-containing protein [Cupriavidus gilardii]|uniref:DGQHR domain-containing protein n=1 Tax=Cupriavidus gilardii TaxID=82541 RepID=UPI0021BF50DE|nr:DGQHR domain-containing protein [Cupriavidus gilardii]MCT9117863.1 DGQHR domain-containing protein [Cupriavidus gilardii]
MGQFSKLPLIKVSQWLGTWDQALWTRELPEPPHNFYVASVPILTLRRLAGVSRRQLEERRHGTRGAGYQRAHQSSRSRSIAQYLRYGYPLSSQPSLRAEEHRPLIHPGWLPTSILVNVIGSEETRRRRGRDLSVNGQHAVRVVQEGRNFFLEYPADAEDASFFLPAEALEPIEIIDGQHRLFALDEMEQDNFVEDYEVPVVIFDGLTESWQAYLFWVINVEPKKINPSLAFDLYPELRSQAWLESGEGIKVYQEHRAQELTEVLWRHEQSPWRDRIELHGNRVEGHVSNAAFIRSLMVSFVRRWGAEAKIGGLFGSLDGAGKTRVLQWKRSQQAAFLIACWTHIHAAIVDKQKKVEWISACAAAFMSKPTDERYKINPHELHPAFAGSDTLLATDQGARAILVVFNAMCQVAYTHMELETWESDLVSDAPDDEDVTQALREFLQMKAANNFLRGMAENLVEGVEWRTASAPGLTQEEKLRQQAYRGSSGYSSLQSACLASLRGSKNDHIAEAAQVATALLGR